MIILEFCLRLQASLNAQFHTGEKHFLCGHISCVLFESQSGESTSSVRDSILFKKLLELLG